MQKMQSDVDYYPFVVLNATPFAETLNKEWMTQYGRPFLFTPICGICSVGKKSEFGSSKILKFPVTGQSDVALLGITSERLNDLVDDHH